MVALGLTVLRLTLAAVLAAHGAHKLFGAFGGPGMGPGGLSVTAQHFADIGLAPGLPFAMLGGLIQFAAGILLFAGLLTRWAAIAAIGYLAIGIWKEHLAWGFFLNWTIDQTRGHGIEYSVMLIGALACLALGGGGAWSLDGHRAYRRESRAAGRARIRTRV